MSGYYPLYVGASLSNSSQQVGMGLLRLYDTANGGFGSLAIYDSGVQFRDVAGNIISIGGGGGGDMVLASVQTVTGAKTFNDSTLFLANVAGTFSSKFTNTNTAARTYTLPDAAGTVALTSNITGTNSGTNTGDQTITLTGAVTGSGTGSFAASLGSFTKSQLDTAVSDANVMYVGDAPTAHNQAFSTITSTPTTLTGYGITDAATSTHIHGNITNAGAIGATANLPLITTTSGVVTVGTFGTTANSFCQGNDSRLSDARTPVAHSTDLLTSGTLPVVRGGTGLAALGTSLQVLRTNAGATALEYATITDVSGFGVISGSRFNSTDNSSGASLITVNATNVLNRNSDGIMFLDNSYWQSCIVKTNGVDRVTISNSGLAVAGSVTISGGTPIAKVLSATATLDFPSISGNDTHTLTMTVTGAVTGNAVFIGVPAALDANLIWCASVTAADTVTIRMHNASGSSVDPASGTYRATVFQF